MLYDSQSKNSMWTRKLTGGHSQWVREDLRSEDLGAYFGGGFGGALMEAFDVDRATPEELVQIAQERGIDLGRYVVG